MHLQNFSYFGFLVCRRNSFIWRGIEEPTWAWRDSKIQHKNNFGYEPVDQSCFEASSSIGPQVLEETWKRGCIDWQDPSVSFSPCERQTHPWSQESCLKAWEKVKGGETTNLTTMARTMSGRSFNGNASFDSASSVSWITRLRLCSSHCVVAFRFIQDFGKNPFLSSCAKRARTILVEQTPPKDLWNRDDQVIVDQGSTNQGTRREDLHSSFSANAGISRCQIFLVGCIQWTK